MNRRRLGIHGVLGLSLALVGLTPGCEEASDTLDEVTSEPAPTTAAGDASRGGASSRDAGPARGPGDIVATASAAPNFTVLTKALTDTGLVATLEGKGPFTVFAPTDEAFEALPSGTLEALSTEQLKSILLYHVVASELPSSALRAGPVSTASGLTAFVSLSGSTVKVNEATVIQADVEASNGVIHAIDEVLLPPNLVQAATYAGTFSTLLEAATRAGLAETLASPDQTLTLFAPTDDAFAALPAGTVAGLSDAQLADVLKYHVVSGKVLSTDLEAGAVPTLLEGESLNVSLSGGGVKVNDATVQAADVVTTNGVIHVVDGVLLPE